MKQLGKHVPCVAFCIALGSALLFSIPARAGVDLQMYGDIDYSVTKTDGKTTDRFGIPLLDIMPTASFERLTFLAEAIFEYGDSNEVGVDVERVEIGYQVKPWLRIRAGRFHTALGYYNDAFHHGTLFQLAASRPLVVAFEDDGGLIPAHSVGIHADGQFQLSSTLALRYDVDLSNGRGVKPQEVTNVIDSNHGKAVNLRLRLLPAFAEGLTVGGNLYLDTIPAAPGYLAEGMSERILAAHLVYMNHGVHFIGELFFIHHELNDGTGTFRTRAAFVEAGYTIGSLTPYIGYEVIDLPPDLDPFYALSDFGTMGTIQAPSGGLRWLANENLALKLFGRYQKADFGSAVTNFGLQCAFGF